MPTLNAEFRYDWVIFDVGGTLIGFHEPEPFQAFLAHAGLPATDEDARLFHRRLLSVILAERDGAQGLGAVGEELAGWWRGNFAKTWPDRPDLAEEMLHWLYTGRFDRLFADSKPALEALRALGLPLAVLSNFDLHLEEVLTHLGLRPFFDFVIASAVVGLAKPDPRIFDLVVTRANRPRQRLLYVGDHVGDDIEGAWGAGLDAVLIDRSDRHAAALCPRIGSLLDLVHYVRPPAGLARAIVFDMDGVGLDSMPLSREILTSVSVPGLPPLLHDLRGRGYRLGLVTGRARSVVDESLASTGVMRLFDAIVAGDQVSRGKPDPEAYRAAAARLGVLPSECLAVANAPLGIRSAIAAGMGCVALETTLPAEQLAGADRTFPHVGALRAWLLSR